MANGVDSDRIKYCIDCRHFKDEIWCKRPQRISIVTGEPQPTFAVLERKTSSYLLGEDPINKCGPDAIYFEQKELPAVMKPWWRFWN